jgi:phage portal protein, SPP1 gp6-like
MNYRGIEYLRRKLQLKKIRVAKRYNYYAMKNHVPDFGISTPPKLRNMVSTLGWCGKAVDSIADRLIFREFEKDVFDINTIYQLNNSDVLFDSAILGALISSCSFIYITTDRDRFPKLQVINGDEATGIIDTTTGMLREGYAVLEKDIETKRPTVEAYFTAEYTIVYRKFEGVEIYHNPAPFPLLVPIIYRPDANRTFGRSRISRACMSLVEGAARTVKRSEISAEFFSFPQKWVTGLDEDAEIEDKWQAAMSAMFTLTKSNSKNDSEPKFGQFTQQSMQPHTEQLKMFAALFAGETGLTLDDLGFVTDNPSSQEAIKASHECLRLSALKAQRGFGTGFLNVGYLAACVRDAYEYKRSQIYMTKPKWEPIFSPDATMLSSIGDGAIKINQAVPGYFGKNNLRDVSGIAAEEQ